MEKLKYNDVLNGAVSDLENARWEYATDKVKTKLADIEAKKNHIKYLERQIDGMEADLADLLTKEVGIPPIKSQSSNQPSSRPTYQQSTITKS